MRMRLLLAALTLAWVSAGSVLAQEQTGGPGVVKADTLPQANPAKRQWLVLIGVDDYQNDRFLGDLRSCKRDLQGLRDLLYARFGYSPEGTAEVFDAAATCRNIEEKMSWLLEQVGPDDSVLIVFSGHGRYDEDAKLGYWYPYEAAAAADGIPNWLVCDWCRRLKARKVLVIADSCFAGSLLAHEGFTPDATRKSRELLAAGGLHPIADAGSSDGERSVFISCLCKGLTALADAGRPFITKDLFAEVYGPLKAKSAQEPQNGILRDTFHEGGQFLFYPVRKASGEGTVEKPPSPERGVTAKGLSLDLGGGVTMNLALIPAGQFTAGGEGSNPDCVRGNTKHRVRITKPFYIGVTEVTQEQYEAVIGKNPSNVHGAKNPVECVSWSDAQEFCKKLNARLAASSQHSALRAQHLSARLPTEAEWEYACRAGSTGAYCFGDSGAQLADYAWYKDNAGDDTHPVGEKKPNAWGLYDMHGNVWEMCQDWHGHYPSGTVDDPIGPTTGYSRVIRGGAWSQSPMQARSAFRDWVCNPTGPSVYAGFRVVVVAK